MSMMESMFHACTNMGEFLSLVRHWSSSQYSSALLIMIKSVNYSPIHIEVAPPPLTTKEKMEKNTATDDQVSNFWQHQLPGDIMETIVMRLSLTDRIRMSTVCKSWRAPLLMDNKNLMINGGGGGGATPDIPWLLLPRGEGPAAAKIDNQRLFSFYSMSEGRFYNLELPKKALGGDCCGCIRGWLALITTTQLFLWNPLSGALLELPSLTTIPCFQEFLSDSLFINRIDILFVNASAEQYIVAILCNFYRTLAFCTLGDTRWIIFKENIDDKLLYNDILFINNVLYTVDLDVTEEEEEERDSSVVETHTIVLTNNCQVMMKSIKHVFNLDKLPYYEIQPGGFAVGKHFVSTISLLESAQGELLIARQNIDFFTEENEDGNYDYPGPGPGIEYYQTKGFEIFKVDIHSPELMHKLTSLGDQVLFYSDHRSLSIPTPKFGKENCIYFATTATPFCGDSDNFPQVSREAGVFNLEDGTIKRYLPSFKLPLQSVPAWLTPNLHLLPR